MLPPAVWFSQKSAISSDMLFPESRVRSLLNSGVCFFHLGENASFLAMHRALDQLGKVPDSVLVDGNRFTAYNDIKHHCIVKGDEIYMSIAAASILAKTYRDDMMTKLAKELPFYGWERNMGYPTKMHREGIRKHGATPFHRMSFQLLPV